MLVPFQPVWGGAEKVAAGLAEYYRDAATIKVHALNEPLPENGHGVGKIGRASCRERVC